MWTQPRCSLPCPSLHCSGPHCHHPRLWCACHSWGPLSSHPRWGGMQQDLRALSADHHSAFLDHRSPRWWGPWHRELSVLCFPQVQRRSDLPLHLPTHPSSPHHQRPVPSLLQEDRVAESWFAESFLPEKPSAHPRDASPQRCTADPSPPAPDLRLQTHVDSSVCSRMQFTQQVCSEDLCCARAFPALGMYQPPAHFCPICRWSGAHLLGPHFSLCKCTDTHLKGYFQE